MALVTPTNWNTFFKGFKLPHPPGKPDKQLPTNHRIAFLLHWAREKGPGLVVPYNIILKFIMGFEHTPRTSNEEVELLRKKMSSVRPILQGKYKCDLKTVPGVGARATTDDLDTLKNTTVNAVKRVKSAHEALKRNTSNIDASKLPTSGPDKEWRDWYSQSVSPALKALGNDERIAKLLPPAMTAKTERK